jgi:uncharacterized protein
VSLTYLQMVLAVLSGTVVGFSLGLVGGGGSVMAVPLLVYVVGVANPHIAIGTSAVAVAINAGLNLIPHARAGNVKWHCALVFAAVGVVGALAGSVLGKAMDGQRLLALFAVIMLVISGLMLRGSRSEGDASVTLSRENLPRLIFFGLGTGLLSGFFGIGGGFLIVPALIAATGMPMLNAIGSSLVSVTSFGLATAGSYAWSGLVDILLVVLFVAGGVVGGVFGVKGGIMLSSRKGALTKVFAAVLIAVAIYMLIRSLNLF